MLEINFRLQACADRTVVGGNEETEKKKRRRRRKRCIFTFHII